MGKLTLLSPKTGIIYVLILVNLISICLDLMENLTQDFTLLITGPQSLSRLNMLTQLESLCFSLGKAPGLTHKH
jgi:hypothetical protein